MPAYLESDIPKLGGPVATQAVVLEAGGFDCPLRGELDAAFDRTTIDPGFYTYEKMFSGAYLGPLALHVLKHLAHIGFFSPVNGPGFFGASRIETADVAAFLARPLDADAAAQARPRDGGCGSMSNWRTRRSMSS